MTESVLFMVAPWILFGVSLALLCVRLFRARRDPDRSPSARRGQDD